MHFATVILLALCSDMSFIRYLCPITPITVNQDINIKINNNLSLLTGHDSRDLVFYSNFILFLQDHPFEDILAKELYEKVAGGQMIAVCHKHSCSSEELFEQRVLLHRNNMEYVFNMNKVSYRMPSRK